MRKKIEIKTRTSRDAKVDLVKRLLENAIEEWDRRFWETVAADYRRNNHISIDLETP